MFRAAPVAEPWSYPRVYKPSGGWFTTLIVFGALFALGGLCSAWIVSRDAVVKPQNRNWLVGFLLSVAIFGVYCILSALRSRVVLFADRIEVKELTRTFALNRDDIRGWRSLPTSPPAFVFVPRDDSHRTIKVAWIFRQDPEFAEWVYTLPCLDDEDRRKSKSEIRNDNRYGATPGDRMKTLARSRRTARVLAVLSSLALLWGFLYPRPYELVIAILAVLPWLGLEVVRRSGGLLTIDAPRNDPHPTVAFTYLGPSLVLLLRAVMDYNIIPTFVLVWLTIGPGALLFFSAIAVDRTVRAKRGLTVSLLALSLVYGYGVAIEANGLLDRSAGTNFTTKVEDKRIVRGRTTTYELALAHWGPKTKTNRLRVGRPTYDYIQRGDVVFITLQHGALGLNWYFMRSWTPGNQ